MDRKYIAELVRFEGNPTRKINFMKGHSGILKEDRQPQDLFLSWTADFDTEDIYALRTSKVLSVEQAGDLITYRTANSVYVFRDTGEVPEEDI